MKGKNTYYLKDIMALVRYMGEKAGNKFYIILLFLEKSICMMSENNNVKSENNSRRRNGSHGNLWKYKEF